METFVKCREIKGGGDRMETVTFIYLSVVGSHAYASELCVLHDDDLRRRLVGPLLADDEGGAAGLGRDGDGH